MITVYLITIARPIGFVLAILGFQSTMKSIQIIGCTRSKRARQLDWSKFLPRGILM